MMSEELVGKVEQYIRESIQVKQALLSNAARIAEIGRVLIKALGCGRRVLVFGNGGSAADAQHIVAELVGRYRQERPPFKALALTTNTSLLTAIANDYAFEDVFARQVEAFGQPGDVAIGISTSGNSQNVIAGIRVAKRMGLVTIGLTGQDGGQLRLLVDHWIGVPSRDTPRVQEAHILIGHILCDLIEGGLSNGEVDGVSGPGRGIES
jgi:D-sedoheptulose 7-phosphate isomerase